MDEVQVLSFSPDDPTGDYVPMTSDELAALRGIQLPGTQPKPVRRSRGAGMGPVTLMLGSDDLEDGFRIRSIPGEESSPHETVSPCVSGECPKCGSCLSKAGICSTCEGDYTDGFGQGFVAAAVTAEFGKTTSGGDIFVFALDHPRHR